MQVSESNLSCPACGSLRVTDAGRFTVDAREAAQHFVLAEADSERHQRLTSHIRALWARDTCMMMRCGDCSLEFADPFVAGDGVFYNLAYPYSDYPVDKWEFQKTLACLKSLPLQGKRGLEIGAGFGHFLSKVSPSVLPESAVVGIEYNTFAGQKLRERGFEWIDQDVRSDAFSNRKAEFDFVFMFQVLEHMDRLPDLFKRLKYICKPGADLFIAVPNPGRIRFNEESGSLLDMPPNHISLWSEESFVALASRIGATVVRFEVEPIRRKQFLKQDLVYSYLRKAQSHGSLANLIRRQKRSRFRLALEAAYASMDLPRRGVKWLGMSESLGSLGGSLWAHLKFS